MSEHRSGNPWGGIVFALALALGGGLLLAIYLIGGDALRTMGLILIAGLTLALVIGASALPIRAWRRKDATGESHHYHDGTKTVVRETRIIDGRAPTQTDIKLLQMPAQQSGALYPELLRAAYSAGRLSPTSTALGQQPAGGNYDPRSAYTEAELPTVGFEDDDGWGGDITPTRL